MKEIQLTKGFVAQVDNEDYTHLSQFKWHEGQGYAVRNITNPDGTQSQRLMHHELLPGVKVDHKDGNGFNNCRHNLRPCTVQQNAWNSKQTPGISGFRGVTKNGDKWQAKLACGTKPKYLGTYATAELAAHVYDVYILEQRGEFAVLNFPKEG